MDELIDISLKKVPDFVFEGSFFILCIIVAAVFLFARNGATLRKLVLGSMLVEYIFLVLSTTILFREVRSEAHYMMQPFWSVMAYLGGKKVYLDEILLNIILFIPIGLLVSSFNRMQNWWKVLLFGCGLSACIELSQLIFHRGLCETDDVISNSIGCMIGYGIYKGLASLKTRFV